MAHTATHITAPVTISDVRAVLGLSTATGLLGLCRSSRINRWSLRKPVIASALHDLSDTQLAAASFGFTINTYPTPAELLAALAAGTAWDYTPPDGRYSGGIPTAWQPCRLGDWRGYNHAAEPFIVSPGDISFNPDRYTYRFFAAETVTAGLSWRDMEAIAHYYPCVAVLDNTGATVGWKTASAPFGAKAIIEGGEAAARTVTLTANRSGADLTLRAGEQYTYIMCAASTRKTSFTAAADASTTFRPIPAEPALSGHLTYSQIIDYLTFTIAGVLGGTPVTGGSRYAFADPYARGYIGPIADTAAYLGLGDSGQLALLVRIDNSDTVSHTTTYARVHASRTLVADTPAAEKPQIFLASAPDTDGLRTLTSYTIPSINIPARSTAYYAMYCTYLMSINADGIADRIPDGALASPIMTLEWNDSGAAQPLRAMLRVCRGADRIIDLPDINTI